MSIFISDTQSFSHTSHCGIGSSTAVGDAAANIRRSLDEAGVGGPHSMYTQRRSDAYVLLLDACETASQEGWDGYHGAVADVAAFIVADAFVRTIPASVPLPDIAVHPDGQIGFDWLLDRDHMFSLAIDGAGTIAYAGRAGDKKVTGREDFRGVFPPTVHFHLASLLSSAG